jgi:hypothetical protein
MNDNDIELLLYRIIAGKTIFYYNNEEYILYSPSVDIKYRAAIIYDNIINEEKYYNWLREDDIEKIMISLGIWIVTVPKQLEAFEKGLDDLKVELFQSFFTPSKAKDVRKKIKSTKENISKIYKSKQEFMSHTLEGYASSIKNEYVICNTLYKDNQLVFQNSNNKSYTLFNNLIYQIDKLMITTEIFKQISRSGLWRGYWNSNKSDVFGSSAASLTDEQKALINISRMYDNIYEHPECPDEKIIDDDDALDGWMIVQKRKNDKERKKSQFDNSNPKMKNAGEVFVMSESQEDKEQILDMNSIESKKDMREKFNFLNKQGTVEDGALPDVQRDMRSKIFQLKQQQKSQR